MKLRPLHDRIIVKRLESETKSAGGIVIPDSAAEKPSKGEVIAVGPGKRMKDGKYRALDVKVGDQVLFEKYNGRDFKENNQELVALQEKDIIGIIEK